ncbi:class B sortase [Serpentinicella sp. ANB-PHB4]|uniref:class B sortase n=1 Tax=Serpentinicella sp. ANB-PHB4 TaxID=3074076 RepID=UPI00286282EF|nr:class B sortase [Serpentinicella sp. ANB-PHB4]MDR5658774.1 class B sortase [Serpentinicella sp. ANB-PHB4]
MKKKMIYFIVACIFLFSVGSILLKLNEYRKNARDYNAISEIYYVEQDYYGGEELTNERRFESLLELNQDTVGWIRIDNTRIDYPVVQSHDNSHYLNINFMGNRNEGGAIFMDYRNNPVELDLNTVIYGHQMRDGSMFKALKNYKEYEFFNQEKIIQFNTPHGEYQWEIYSVYVSDPNEYYITPNFNTEEAYTDFLNHTIHASMHTSDVELTTDDKILTLSTCSYDFDDARFVVHARQVKTNENLPALE